MVSTLTERKQSAASTTRDLSQTLLAAQVGFSATVRRISSRTSVESFSYRPVFSPARSGASTVENQRDASEPQFRRDFLQSEENRHASTKKSQKELAKR